MINKVNKAHRLKYLYLFKLLKKFFSFKKETFYIIALVTGGLFFLPFTFYILLFSAGMDKRYGADKPILLIFLTI